MTDPTEVAKIAGGLTKAASVLWSDEIEELVALGFAGVSRNPSDHETVVAYRAAIHAALRTGEQRERDATVAWLRKGEVQHIGAEFESADSLATAIERGEHLERKP